MIGVGDNHLTVRAIKRMIDGALGSRGAWMLEPYSDLAGTPNRSGLTTEDPADIRKTAELAIANGFQLCVHAIGDRANREVLNIYEAVFKEHPDKKDLRWRIEHAQHIECGRYSALCEAGRDRVDAGHPLHVGRAVRDFAAGAEARRRGRVRLAEAHEVGRGGDQWNGYAGGRCRSDRVLLRLGEPEVEGWLGVFSGSADEPDGGAAVVHGEQCLRGV